MGEHESKFYDLILASLCGIATEQQQCQLAEILKNDEALRSEYLNYIAIYTLLSRRGGASVFVQEMDDSALDMSVWEALAKQELEAETVVLDDLDEAVPNLPVKLLKVEKPPRQINKFSLYSAIISVAAVFVLVLVLQMTPVRPAVASLTDSIHAEWVNVSHMPTVGQVLRQDDILTLARGIAEITFDNGAVVIVEAPAVFELETAKSMFLTSGRVSALVSKYATGFTVNTPNASIVDLGTEFGVSVEGDGVCSLHMFKGKANLIAGKDEQKKNSQVVVENKACRVSAKTGAVKDIPLADNSFIRRVDSVCGLIWRGEDLDMADVVAGGNGLGTGHQKFGIDPSTGKTTFYPLRISERPGCSGYFKVPECPFVDGVFIPDIGNKPTVITSKGDVFAECPDTNGAYWTEISSLPLVGLAEQGYADLHLARLEGVECGTPDNPAILMHANCGITFDLDAIREAMPGVRIKGFTAIGGLSETCWVENACDVWVLLDGQVRDAKHIDNRMVNKETSNYKEFDISINETHRFLTLIATDGGDQNGVDWTLFARPVLRLEGLE